jgi:hypothetical protein
MKKYTLIITAFMALMITYAKAGESFGSASEELPKETIDFALLKNTQDNRYIVSLNNVSVEKLRLSFTDNAGHEIYTELIEGASIYNRRFDLANLTQGSYKVRLENLGSSIQKEIIVK